MDLNYEHRYLETHRLWARRKLPLGYAAGHYLAPKIPDITKTNGLTDYCCNMINWLGGNMTRTNVIARRSEKIIPSESGGYFVEKRYIKSGKKGRADLEGGLRGKQLVIEIKNKFTKDSMKPAQWKEKQRIENGGGQYWIVTCVEDFLQQLDCFLYGQ